MITRFILKLLLLTFTHTVASRLISIPIAIALFEKWYLAVLFIFILDIIQIPAFYFLYESPQKIKFILVRFRYWRMKLNRLYKKEKLTRKDRTWQASILKRAQKLGQWGVIFVAAMPSLGGGMWSGVLLAHLLKINKKRSYVLIGSASLMSCLVLALGFGGIKAFLLYVFSV